jgi:hypothetical protein
LPTDTTGTATGISTPGAYPPNNAPTAPAKGSVGFPLLTARRSGDGMPDTVTPVIIIIINLQRQQNV